MNNKENIKIALLGVIALTLIVNTFMGDGSSGTSYETTAQPGTPPVSNIAATSPNNPNTLNANLNTQPNLPANEAPAIVNTGPTTAISFAKDAHNFGNIKQDTENKHIFKFTNTGKNPLIIENARGSCGCTVPKFPKEPIAPGEQGEIEVEYKPGKQKGNQTKTVTITANTDPRDTRINISAFVEEIPVEAN